ncbi:glycine-rich protein 23-like isoform X1 [Rhinatrema bivittatum]|uniref:glycine-rich protein 23-like isoform X1 n=1 Tax=Rhinatrema bivittatum TaxID=194408 RepID=UPI0011299EAD|nr:glycine-rich protein 23-like isoform X1 [Rhinatrema bivittatum]
MALVYKIWNRFSKKLVTIFLHLFWDFQNALKLAGIGLGLPCGGGLDGIVASLVKTLGGALSLVNGLTGGLLGGNGGLLGGNGGLLGGVLGGNGLLGSLLGGNGGLLSAVTGVTGGVLSPVTDLTGNLL